jgi:hypothetical protein
VTRKLGLRVTSALVLATAAATMAAVLPAQAQSHTGKLGNQFTYTYYATAAHTGSPVGEWTFGYCPTYFSVSSGTRTAYFVTSEMVQLRI